MVENLKIHLNAKIIQRLKSEDIYSDHMGSVIAVLIALDKGRIDLLDELDDFNKSKRLLLLYKQLEHRGFLESLATGKVNFKLTKKAQELLTFLYTQFKEEHVDIVQEVFKETPKKVVVVKAAVEEWIDQYNELFPKDFQCHKHTLIPRMQVFVDTFPSYNKDIILQATKKYIQEHQNSEAGFAYMRQAEYFIFKGHGSTRIWDLATWCKKVKDNANNQDYDTKFLETA